MGTAGQDVEAARQAVIDRIALLHTLAGGTQAELQRASGLSEPTLRDWGAGRIPARRSSATPVTLDSWVQAEHERAVGERRTALRAAMTPSLADLVEDYRQALERPAEPAADASIDSRRTTWPWGRLLAGAALLALLLGFVAIGVHRSGSAQEADATQVPVRATLQLDEENFCTWQLGIRPIPLVSRDPLVMRVDARCNYPADPNPLTDPGASVYGVPSNEDPGQRLGVIRDGQTVRPQCFEPAGQEVSDGSAPQNTSTIWVLVRDADGLVAYLPNVNFGGGYTRAQLLGMGLARC